MDILVIGNGLAGLSAAAEAAKKGASVTLVSQNPADRSQSVMAEGGINAAMNTKGENDSVLNHCEDTLRSACGLASEKAVAEMTAAAPDIIRYLSNIGVVFSRDEQGREDLRFFGGQKKRRTVFAKSGIGKQLVCGLAQEARRYAAQGKIKLKEHHHFEELIVRNSACEGAVFRNIFTGRTETICADAVIMATGGMNALFGETTGSLLSDGSATAAVFRQGVKLANCEMVQYHPTTALRGGKRILISEAARGEGGRLFVLRNTGNGGNGEKWYFMEEMYPEGGNLMPRDIVSQTMEKVSRDYGQVYLDLTHLSAEALEYRLHEVCEVCRAYLGIDPASEYIPVSPGVHYFMGGLYVDNAHRCSMRGLYAAGECACQYHGANRLGGNSTMGAVYGGIKAAQTAVSDCIAEQANRAAENATGYMDITASPVVKKELQRIVGSTMGIRRSEEGLLSGIAEIEKLKSVEGAEERENRNLLLLAEAMLKSALERKESRGAHVREDFPERDDGHFKKLTVAECDEKGNILISFAEVN